MKEGEDLEPLKHAFGNLPSLRAIEMYHGHDDEKLVARTFFYQAVEAFGCHLQEKSTIPCSESRQGLLNSRTQSFLTGSTLSTHPIQSMKLDVGHNFLDALTDLRPALQAAQHLSDLSLRIFIPSRLPFLWSGLNAKRKTRSSRLADFIGSSKKLKSLCLAYRFVGEGDELFCWRQDPDARDVTAITDELILRSADIFQNLQSFTLHQGSSTVEQLLALLSSFKRLRYLELKGIKLEAGSWLTFLRGCLGIYR